MLFYFLLLFFVTKLFLSRKFWKVFFFFSVILMRWKEFVIFCAGNLVGFFNVESQVFQLRVIFQ